MKFSNWKKKRSLPFSLSKRSEQKYSSFLLKEKKKERTRSDIFEKTPLPLLFFWKKYKSVVLGVGLGIFIFCILALIFFSSNVLDIREIALTRKDLRVNVNGISRILSPLRGQNIALITERKIRAMIQEKFPEVKKVELEKNWPDRITVVIETHPVVVQWQFQAKTEKKSDATTAKKDPAGKSGRKKTVYLNIFGKVSPAEPEEKEAAFLMVETIETIPEEFAIGAAIYPAERMKEILETKDILETKTPFKIVSAEVFREAQEVHFLSENGTALWLDFFTPFSEQIAKIDASLTETPLFEKELSYLDLRIQGKLIYKEK